MKARLGRIGPAEALTVLTGSEAVEQGDRVGEKIALVESGGAA